MGKKYINVTLFEQKIRMKRVFSGPCFGKQNWRLGMNLK